MKRKQLFLLCICIVMILFTSCQPTPKTGKEAIIPGSSPAAKGDDLSDTPSSYEKQDTLADGIGLEVKAEVILPRTPLCIAKVNRFDFDLPLIEKVTGVLFGDAPIYQYTETKQKLIQASTVYKMQLETARDMLGESDILSIESVIDDMEKAIPDKPDSEKPASLEKILSDYDGWIEADTGRERKATLHVMADDRRQIITFDNKGFKKEFVGGSGVPCRNSGESDGAGCGYPVTVGACG